MWMLRFVRPRFNRWDELQRLRQFGGSKVSPHGALEAAELAQSCCGIVLNCSGFRNNQNSHKLTACDNLA